MPLSLYFSQPGRVKEIKDENLSVITTERKRKIECDDNILRMQLQRDAEF